MSYIHQFHVTPGGLSVHSHARVTIVAIIHRFMNAILNQNVHHVWLSLPSGASGSMNNAKPSVAVRLHSVAVCLVAKCCHAKITSAWNHVTKDLVTILKKMFANRTVRNLEAVSILATCHVMKVTVLKIFASKWYVFFLSKSINLYFVCMFVCLSYKNLRRCIHLEICVAA